MIQAHQLGKQFLGHWVVKDVSFQIQQGEVVCLLGLDGAGKSTLLALLAGAIAPTEGEIYIQEKELWQSPAALRAPIGYLPQTMPLSPEETVRETLTFRARLSLKRVDAKEAVQQEITAFGLEAYQGQLVQNLSAGQKKRLALAASFVGRPKILLLDDPFLELDHQGQLALEKRIAQAAETSAIVFSARDVLLAAKILTRALVLRDGRLAGTWTQEKEEKNVCRVRVRNRGAEKSFASSGEFQSVERLAQVEADTTELRLVGKTGTDVRERAYIWAAKHQLTLLGLSQETRTKEEALMDLLQSTAQGEVAQ